MEIKKLISIISLIVLVGCQSNSTLPPSNSTLPPSGSAPSGPNPSGPIPSGSNPPPMPNNTYSDAAPQICALTAAAQARLNSSTCFAGLQSIISCMPPPEQDLWAYANAQNTNSTVCFDCSVIKGSIKNSFKQNTNALGNKLTKNSNDQRNALSCFVSFAKSSLTSSDLASINTSLATIVSNQKIYGQASAQVLQNVGNVFIGRRRFLCMANADRAKLVSANDTATNSASDFIYNMDEATTVVNAFITFFQTQISTMSSMANEVSSMTDIVANSVNCVNNSTTSRLLRYLQGTPAANTNTTNSTVPPSGPAPANGTVPSGAKPSSGSGPSPSGSAGNGTVPSGAKPSSGSGPSPSGSKPTGPKSNGKALGNDVSAAVTTVSLAMSNLKSSGALDFVSRISSSFNGTAQNCQPSGFNNFVQNLNLSGPSRSLMNSLLKINSLCTADAIYIVSNGIVACEGNCGTNFTQITLAFTDSTKAPSAYYFASGCASGQRFTYGTWTNIVTSTLYTSFKYNSIDTDKRCLSKAAGCVPGGNMKGGNVNDGACSGASMASKCSDGLNSKCAASRLANQTITPPTSLPSPCDSVAQGLDATSQTFISTCFKWIAKTFLRRSVAFSPDQLASLTVIGNAPQGRVLQSTDATIVPTSQDPSMTVTTFQGVSLTSTDVSVDGSTPTSIGSTTDGLAQIDTNSTATSSTSGSESTTFGKILLLAVFALLI